MCAFVSGCLYYNELGLSRLHCMLQQPFTHKQQDNTQSCKNTLELPYIHTLAFCLQNPLIHAFILQWGGTELIEYYCLLQSTEPSFCKCAVRFQSNHWAMGLFPQFNTLKPAQAGCILGALLTIKVPKQVLWSNDNDKKPLSTEWFRFRPTEGTLICESLGAPGQMTRFLF